jgi:hypothetical protein
VAKRSPILGYNHNVKYRGLVFHVQTEDSGLLNPHLFTHLFFGGVIVQTRKLVYDAGANEEAIKALMQAQHKAVMKDLMKGAFDEKIDQYLAGTPGLEPARGAPAGKPKVRGERAPTEVDANTGASEDATAATANASAPLEIVNEGLSEPIELPLKHPDPPAHPITVIQPAKSRTQTAERISRGSPRHPPPPPEDDAPTLLGSDANDMAAAIATANAATASGRTPTPVEPTVRFRDSAPVVEARVDEPSSRNRVPRDTALDSAFDEAIQPPPSGPSRPRPPSHGAAALPPMRPAARPQSPPIVARPAERKRSGDSEAAEIYAPAPPSAEPPPGERTERPGQYSVNRKHGDAPIREKTGRIEAINPAALAAGAPGAAARGRAGERGAGPHRPGTPPPTPGRGPNVTAPISNRPQAQSGSGGVVMSRPAVIVGAPKAASPASGRVRKAREDEGRGFGQGLISEKSLDEVILAYLSEDAEDK